MGHTSDRGDVGYTFTIPHTFDNSWNNNKKNFPPPHPPGTYLGDLKITVTSIVYNAEYNWYTFTYQDDTHDHYEETNLEHALFANSNPINCDTTFAKTSGTWKTYDSKDAEQKTNPAKWACKGPTLVPGTAGGFGDWYTEYTWSEFSATALSGHPGSGQFPCQCDSNDQVDLIGGTCYDYSTYSYPGLGPPITPIRGDILR